MSILFCESGDIYKEEKKFWTDKGSTYPVYRVGPMVHTLSNTNIINFIHNSCTIP